MGNWFRGGYSAGRKDGRLNNPPESVTERIKRYPDPYADPWGYLERASVYAGDSAIEDYAQAIAGALLDLRDKPSTDKLEPHVPYLDAD